MEQNNGKWPTLFQISSMRSKTDVSNIQLGSLGEIKFPSQSYTKELTKTSYRFKIRQRKWRWIGHVNILRPIYFPMVPMSWTPNGTRKRGGPRGTLRIIIIVCHKNN